MDAEEVKLLDRLTRHPASTTSLQAVLRCLDLKEFVRDDVIASSEFAYSLGEVLCCFSTWTAEGVCGRWAGCRFDITVIQHVDDSRTDVSEEAVEHLEEAGLDRKTDGKLRSYVMQSVSHPDTYLHGSKIFFAGGLFTTHARLQIMYPLVLWSSQTLLQPRACDGEKNIGRCTGPNSPRKQDPAMQ
ncbi:hypothetical protein LTR27_007984 [Elasticomyces elasticus]|nr:hypothetical protein LTR27_007984 [Elasticomyces elasticus]